MASMQSYCDSALDGTLASLTLNFWAVSYTAFMISERALLLLPWLLQAWARGRLSTWPSSRDPRSKCLAATSVFRRTKASLVSIGWDKSSGIGGVRKGGENAMTFVKLWKIALQRVKDATVIGLWSIFSACANSTITCARVQASGRHGDSEGGSLTSKTLQRLMIYPFLGWDMFSSRFEFLFLIHCM